MKKGRCDMHGKLERTEVFDRGESKLVVTFKATVTKKSAIVIFSPKSGFASWPEDLCMEDIGEFKKFVSETALAMVSRELNLDIGYLEVEFNQSMSGVHVRPRKVGARFVDMATENINLQAM